MAEERITITIDAEGKVQASTEGFKGDVCIEELEKLLGDLVELEKITETDEHHQQVRIAHRQKV